MIPGCAPRYPRSLPAGAFGSRNPGRRMFYAERAYRDGATLCRHDDHRDARQERARGQALAPQAAEAQASCSLAATGAHMSPGGRRGGDRQFYERAEFNKSNCVQKWRAEGVDVVKQA